MSTMVMTSANVDALLQTSCSCQMWSPEKEALIDNRWYQRLRKIVIEPLGYSIASTGSKLAVLQATCTSHGSTLSSALLGRQLPEVVQKELRDIAAGLRDSVSIGGLSANLTLGDYIACATEGDIDRQSLAELQRVFGGASVIDTPELTAEVVQARLAASDSMFSTLLAVGGLRRLSLFFRDVLKPALHESALKHWSWADVIMVALIYTGSHLWERRLAMLYEDRHRFPRRVVDALALESHRQRQETAQASHNNSSFEPCCNQDELLIYICLRLLMAT